MKNLLLLALLAIAITATAQTVDKVNNGINNVDGNINKTDDAINKLGGWLKKGKNLAPKKDPAPAAAPAATPATPAAVAAVAAPPVNRTVITLSKCDYAGMRDMCTLLSANPDIQVSEKNFNNNTGIITVTHKGNTDSVLDFIDKNNGGKYSITGVNPGSIALVKI